MNEVAGGNTHNLISDGGSVIDFKEFLGKLCKTRCDDVYYCTRHQTLAEGIRRFHNDADYVEFLEVGYEDENEFRMNVYIDHQNEPVLDWADMEVPDEEVEDAEDQDADKDSDKSYTVEYEHAADQEVHSFDKTTDDKFLNKLVCDSNIKNEVNKDDEPNTEDGQGVVFPVHDENQEWETMVPIIGMKFSNPMELKNCVTNYAVKNGYDLWYEKTDCNRLLVKCGKGKRDKNGKSCPFRLWATWMGSEESFQIKSLNRYPCVHGVACILYLNMDCQDFVSQWFTTNMFLKSYQYNIMPLNGSDMWPQVDYIKPLPPKKRRLPGRPTVKRRRDQEEREDKGRKHKVTKTGAVLRCSICKERGHNKVRCPKKPTDGSSSSGLKQKKHRKKQAVEPAVQERVEEEVGVEPDMQEGVQEEVGLEPAMQEGVEEEVGVEEEESKKKIRRKSERITLSKLGKKVGSKEGSSQEQPLEVE
ncbi:hypothetical protein L2E82_15635 [Cichorium intybus]|uniref:Uncharacterized protein n=1 Tax=Cichorium intybus TaxID=13427 RepID=A0ACB9F4L6_CICIN|nr:hypothetical protein L2E82_15635 [Cichorium intybus]